MIRRQLRYFIRTIKLVILYGVCQFDEANGQKEKTVAFYNDWIIEMVTIFYISNTSTDPEQCCKSYFLRIFKYLRKIKLIYISMIYFQSMGVSKASLIYTVLLLAISSKHIVLVQLHSVILRWVMLNNINGMTVIILSNLRAYLLLWQQFQNLST